MGFLRAAARAVVAIDVVFLVLLAFTMLVVERGSEAFIVATLTLIPTGLTFVGALVVLYTGWDPF